MRQAALGTRRMARISGWRRGAAIAISLVFAGGLAIGAAQLAGAAPQESITQAEAQVNADQSKLDKAQQQYDKDNTQLTAAKSRLSQVNSQMAAANTRYLAARKKVVEIAAAGYMGSGQTSLAGLLTASSPGTVLSMASLITELTGARNAESQQLLDDAQQLTSVQQERQNTETGIQQVTKQAKAAKDSAQAAYDHQKSVLDRLDAAQRAQVAAATVGGSSSAAVPNPVDNVPTSSQAGVAVAFVFAHIGCDYIYGGTGPCSHNWSTGYDCSGLVQAAWAAAGVSIPRDTYSQWAALPHVPLSDLKPGDLIFYNGEGHVAMYVGGGMIVDAPHSGATVEEIPESTPWYAQGVDGAARP
jgi:cell wall-associated NlpC family hydrolase